MKDLPKPVEPIIVTTVFDDKDGVERYKGVPVDELLKGNIEDTVWLLWTGRKPTKIQAELARMIIIMFADHGPAVAGAYATVLGESAGLELPQAVAAGVSMIGPRFGGASGAAAKQFQRAVDQEESVEQFQTRLKSEGINIFPGYGHRVFSKSKPDGRVAELVAFAKNKIIDKGDGIKEKKKDNGKTGKWMSNLEFALEVEKELLKKNEKLILNIDGTIGAILLDAGFPIEGIDGFFVLARTIGFIAHYIDQKQRGTALIRLPEELIHSK